MLRRQVREILEDLALGHAGGQILKHVGHGHPGAGERWLATANGRIGDDMGLPAYRESYTAWLRSVVNAVRLRRPLMDRRSARPGGGEAGR